MDNNVIIAKAFMKACKYLREHPPADVLEDPDMEIIQLIYDASSDPEGKRWRAYFVNKVLLEEEDSSRS